MSEDKNTLLSTLVEPISNAANNIADKPTQNMGTTLADIWYLVFGGISQAAEKRKLKYSYALQEFEQELKEKIEKIPEDKRKDPDIQIIAKALEEAKYCIDKEELRNMFSSLIASSMNTDFYVSPVMVNIISSLSPINAKMLNFYYSHDRKIQSELDIINKSQIKASDDTMKKIFTPININELENYLNTSQTEIIKSIIELEHLNLLCWSDKTIENFAFIYQNVNGVFTNFENSRLSILGINFCSICLN